MKLMLAHIFLKKSYTEFQEHLTECLVTDNSLQADEQTLSAHRVVCAEQ
jgi:hypothetical protein